MSTTETQVISLLAAIRERTERLHASADFDAWHCGCEESACNHDSLETTALRSQLADLQAELADLE